MIDDDIILIQLYIYVPVARLAGPGVPPPMVWFTPWKAEATPSYIHTYIHRHRHTCVFAGIYNFSLFLRKCLSDVGGAFFGKAHFLIFRDFAEFMRFFFPGFLVLTWACSNRLSHEDPSTWLPQETIEIHRFSQPFSPYLPLVSEIWWPRAPRDWWDGFRCNWEARSFWSKFDRLLPASVC